MTLILGRIRTHTRPFSDHADASARWFELGPSQEKFAARLLDSKDKFADYTVESTATAVADPADGVSTAIRLIVYYASVSSFVCSCSRGQVP